MKPSEIFTQLAVQVGQMYKTMEAIWKNPDMGSMGANHYCGVIMGACRAFENSLLKLAKRYQDEGQ